MGVPRLPAACCLASSKFAPNIREPTPGFVRDKPRLSERLLVAGSRTSTVIIFASHSGVLVKLSAGNHCHADEVGERLCLHLQHDVSAVYFNGPGADAEVEGDDLVGGTGDQRVHDFMLTAR